jgi:hypothetical protein
MRKILPALLACLLISSFARAADVPIISHIKVLSDKVEDVSSLEAWQKAVIKPQMLDAEKALAIWQTAVKFRHHDVPAPREYLFNDPDVYDAIKLFNVYGYCTGKSAQPAFLQLARYAGFQARHLSVFRFGEPEVFYDNAWHMYDVGMINYFPKADGAVASVDELVTAVKAWHEKNPGYHDNGKKLQAYARDPGFKNGPALVANCPTLQPNGSYPSSNFGWYSTMVIYDLEKPAFVYEEPYSQGYQVNNQLRRGEKITFNWSNKGLHVNMLDEPRKDPDSLTAVVGQKQLNYTPKFGDLANGRIGNGTLEYTPPLDSLKSSAVTYDNLAVTDNKLHPADPAKPAILILDMPCSYVYLKGSLAIESDIAEKGSLALQISDNNGLDWKEIETLTPGKNADLRDLQKFIFRRYDYRLKFTLTGNASINSLKLIHDFQCSQRALPALAQGDNTISFSAGPNEGTVTIEPAPSKHKGQQLTSKDFHAVLNNMNEDDTGHFAPAANDDATVTFPIETPGAITRLRLGGQYRAQDKDAAWLYLISFDNGKTFTTMHQTKDHSRSDFAWITFDKIPPNTKSALVRFQAKGGPNTLLFHLRIDADYQQPNTAPGAFSPISITYAWLENYAPSGPAEKTDAHTAKTAVDSWKITCPTKPTLKSLTLDRAP